MYHIVFIHSSVDGHLCCFRILDIVNSAAMNNGIPVNLNGAQITKRNAFESVLMRWMNLEPIKQSEVSQKEKDKYIF